MKVNVTQPCPACKGKKKQFHQAWVELYNLRKRNPGLTSGEFFMDLGYLPDEQRPPLIIPCRECRGIGEKEAWVPLEVLLPNVLGLVRKLWKGGKVA
jgi:hypothetical protein